MTSTPDTSAYPHATRSATGKELGNAFAGNAT